jgi:drug/metabolite transporter (DMT)-like permease
MAQASNTATSGPDWLRLTPGVFVLLWSTGFIGAKFGLPYAEPLTFLLIRLSLVAAILTLVALAMRAPWPRRWADAGHIMVAGLLVHGVYLGGVFTGISHGLPAGVAALIVGLQPLLTAAASGHVLGERVSRRQWMGLALGLGGVLLVVWENLSLRAEYLTGIALCISALVGITVGTLYQKRFCGGMDLRSGTAIQYAASSLGLLAFAWPLETMQVRWTGEFLFALAWLGLVLSVGAVFLLYVLIRRGVAAQVASLFYLVPPATAVIAYLMFDERLGLLALIGMAVTAMGVALVNRGAQAARPKE